MSQQKHNLNVFCNHQVQYLLKSPIQNSSLILLAFSCPLSAQTGLKGTPAPFGTGLLDSEQEKTQ